ncbi:fumarylacetoacetate hydrolase family protein [Brevundimonas sp.]|uniref:fumarylacetoacetate hydrolase family protein n=1 Tax=Brevundimonas sp. TaxID=1871086 RepID=UPI00289644B1|nr:fumarylacetoacetate hydrolase family protein [Brevundimonas sp.]
MTQWLFPPAPTPSLPILDDTRRFPVRRILCVGQNYAAHAREMGADPSKPAPFFFAKPADALVVDGADPLYPAATANLHHEVELVVAVGEGGAVAGWAVGVDLTRRDLQAEAKAKGRPWESGKAFDQSAPCGPLTLGALPDAGAAITLKVNDEVRQSGRLSDMIWDPAGILAQAAELWTLQPGDLIFTGTPEGVGPLVPGDRVEAKIEGLAPLSFTVKA